MSNVPQIPVGGYCPVISVSVVTKIQILPRIPRLSAPVNASIPTRDAKRPGVGTNRRPVSQGCIRVIGCRAFCLDFEEGLGGKAEETGLFEPVMRQVFAQPQEPSRR